MPVLKNAKHEAFAQALAKGMSASKAFKAAGFKPNRGNATRLKAKDSVSQRVTELLSKAAELTLVSIDSVTSELEEARRMALLIKQPASAVSATMGKAKLHGLLVDKQEHAVSQPLAELLREVSGTSFRPQENDDRG